MYTEQEEKRIVADSLFMIEHIDDLAETDIPKLRTYLKYHAWRYYVNDDAVLTDAQYDNLFHGLRKLEEAFPNSFDPLSPTQIVGGLSTAPEGAIEHLTPMLSLANAYDLEDLEDFEKSIVKLLEKESIDYCVEPKLDGGSVVLRYQQDRLLLAATRGNGSKGEDISANIGILPSIPSHVDFSKFGIDTIELRGEAVIRKDLFEKLNAKRAASGLDLFANPRNTATGGLRMKDPNQTLERGIDVFIYQISYVSGRKGAKIELPTSQYERVLWLEKLGFKTPKSVINHIKGIQEVHSFCEKWEVERDTYPYEIDGIVVKLDDTTMYEEVGETSHHPKWAIAYKFKAKQAVSTLEEIQYQVGKIGSVTPVAKIKPVALAGVTVSSISLHNEDFIKQKDLKIGDQVLVERAGDVIPYIVKSFPELRTGTEKVIEFPKNCPSCDSHLVREEGESAWRCVNAICPAQALQRLIFHVSKNGMDIDGLGKSLVEKLYENGLVKDISDIYNLDYEAMMTWEGLGEKSILNLREAIDRSKQNDIALLLQSLSIHHLGKRSAKLVAAEIDNVFDLLDFSKEQLEAIKDIGPKLSQNVIDFFSDEHNVAMLRRMETYGVNMRNERENILQTPVEGPLVDKSIVFTGSLEHMTRKEAEALAEQHGASVKSSVSSKLNILVVGKNAGSKLTKAEKLGTVQIYTEEAFLDLISDS